MTREELAEVERLERELNENGWKSERQLVADLMENRRGMAQPVFSVEAERAAATGRRDLSLSVPQMQQRSRIGRAVDWLAETFWR